MNCATCGRPPRPTTYWRRKKSRGWEEITFESKHTDWGPVDSLEAAETMLNNWRRRFGHQYSLTNPL